MTTLNEQLTAARKEAAKANEQLATLESQLTAAVEAQEFAEAERLKGLLPDARLAHMVAEGKATGFANALEQYARADAEREAAAAEAERRRQAAEQYDRAYAAEQEAQADLQRAWADIEPTLAAARESMRAAVAAENRVTQARRDAYSARVALGEVEPNSHVAAWNYATAKIEASRLLRTIYYEQQL